MKSDTERDWQWANEHLPAIKKALINRCAMHLIDIEVAPPEADLERATDLIVRAVGGDIAVRVREPGCNYRDLTIRSRRISGVKTEIHKIKEGFGRWYFYGWSDGSSGLQDWILADLNKLRESGLLDRRWRETPNKDRRTWFIAIPVRILDDYGCVVTEKERLRTIPNSNGNKPQFSWLDDLYDTEIAKEMAKIHAPYQDYQD